MNKVVAILKKSPSGQEMLENLGEDDGKSKVDTLATTLSGARDVQPPKDANAAVKRAFRTQHDDAKRVRFHSPTIRNARIENVAKSQSCMVSE